MSDRAPAPSSARPWVFVGLVVVFVGPLLLAGLAYWTGWTGAGGRINHGTLIQPPRQLQAVGLQSLDGSPLPLGFFERKWTLLYVGTADCQSACRDMLYKMRQARLAQGRELDRVQRLYVVTDREGLAALQAFVEESHEGLTLATAQPAALGRLSRQLGVDGTAPQNAHRVYVVDPLGNAMMFYPTDAQPKGMIDDLEHLLEASQIG